MNRAAAAVAAVVLLGRAPGVASAQLIRADATVTAARVTTTLGGGPPRLTGPLVGGEGALGTVVALRGAYAQGRLTAPDGTAWDAVEGGVAIVARPTPWLGFAFGPMARSYVTSGGTLRWIVWELHGTLSIPLATDRLRATLDGWRSIAGSLNTGAAFQSARGMSGGVAVWIPHSPVWATVRYRVERLLVDGGAGSETLDGLAVGAGVALN